MVPPASADGTIGRVRSRSSVVNKISWEKAGRVTEPGRYMFTFGWLTVTAKDVAVWQQFPDAAFTIIKTATATTTDADQQPGDEYRLRAFEMPISRSLEYSSRFHARIIQS